MRTVRLSYVARGGTLLNDSLPVRHGSLQTSMGSSWMEEGIRPIIWRTLEKLSGEDFDLFSYVNVYRTLGASVAFTVQLIRA